MKEEFFKTSMIRKRHAKLSFLSIVIFFLFSFFLRQYAFEVHGEQHSHILLFTKNWAWSFG